MACGVKILVLNAGSSSLKFRMYDGETRLVAGEVERVGSWPAAIDDVFHRIGDGAIKAGIDAVGHRIVHGGDRFTHSVVIDAAVEQAISDLSDLAPLHNPHNVEAYRAARARLPSAVHVAVFDTAFHQTMPEHAYAYGLPYEYLTARKIRRYGFHGISHQYVSGRFAEVTGRPLAELRLISCHLGGGCSVCAIRNGKSIDTSMGLTPLEGLVMGTRCGDIDPGALLHLIEREQMTPEGLTHTLNHESGLAGLSGTSGDMRDLLQAAAGGDARATLAIDVFCYRVKKYIGAYIAAMNGADAVIFTAGIGENAPEIRACICAGMDRTGITVDAGANTNASHDPRQIGFGAIAVWVVPTDEELLIARETIRRTAGGG